MRPTARQHIALQQCLNVHREMYNAALQERRDAWRHSSIRIGYGDQSLQLKDIRRDRPDVAVWSFSSQQATLRRLIPGFRRFLPAGQSRSEAGVSAVQGRAPVPFGGVAQGR